MFVDLPGFTEEEIGGDETAVTLSAERFSELEEGRYALLQERPVHTIELPKTGSERFKSIKIRSG